MKTHSLFAILIFSVAATAQARDASPKPLIVNGPVTVTTDDFEASLLRAPPELRPELRLSMERISKSVENVYTNRVLAEEARKAGLDRDPLVKLRIRQITEAYLAQLWADHYPTTLTAPDFAVRAKEIYTLDKARFADPERLTGTHILISPKWRTRDMALARAREVVAKAIAGEDFASLAKEYSEAPNFKSTGGKLEEVTFKDLEQPIAEAAFSAKPGTIVGPITTDSGIHIILVERRQPREVRPFESVADKLIASEREKFANLSTDRRIGELKNTSQTKIFEDNLRSLLVEIDREAVDRLHREQALPKPSPR